MKLFEIMGEISVEKDLINVMANLAAKYATGKQIANKYKA